MYVESIVLIGCDSQPTCSWLAATHHVIISLPVPDWLQRVVWSAAYLFLIGCDSSPDVRRAVVLNIAVATHTLPAVLARMRDSNAQVRRAAYETVAAKVHMRVLTIAQRLRLLTDGLRDQSGESVATCDRRRVRPIRREGFATLITICDIDHSGGGGRCAKIYDGLAWDDIYKLRRFYLLSNRPAAAIANENVVIRVLSHLRLS